MSEDKEQPSIKVSDRRRFSSEGDLLENEQAAAPEVAEAAASEAEEKQEAPAESASPTSEPTVPPMPPMPEASIELLVMSLGMQAQMELMSPQEGSDAPPPNLDVARHTIDLLDVLKDKTKGNLNFEESRLLDNTLTELRFRYVQRVNEINEKAKG